MFRSPFRWFISPPEDAPQTLKSPNSPAQPKQYNSFEGVFKPTLLTILGVIMYLRTGWVVGNGGLLGGLAIALGAISITLATGLSISSIATNTRLGAGGPYAMISRSLGLEIGGSVGLPLFLSQSLAVAMYIFGFREGWLYLFPHHSPLAVDLTVFGVVWLVTYISAGLAFRLQYVVMGAIALSLVSVFSSELAWHATPQVILWDFQEQSFWSVFAVFFPATTGIMAGVNMSGELRNSRKSIPLGTLAAIALSSLVYVSLILWLCRLGNGDELRGNYMILLENSRWPLLVLGGLLAATFSAALSSLVGAPRILTALARDQILPKGQWLAHLSANGEPRRALVVSGVITFLALLLRDLNAIAPLITIFFLITYGMINVVVLIESSLGLINFRPTFAIPRIVPFYGAIGCLVAMLVINPSFSLMAMVLVLLIYLRLVSQPKTKRSADVRSGIFIAIAEWAATKVIQLDIASTRAWKPSMLVPVEQQSQLLGEYRLILDFCRPEGSITLLGIACHDSLPQLQSQIRELSGSLRKRNVFTMASVIDLGQTPTTAILSALQTLQSVFFRPNVLFLRLPKESSHWEDMQPIFAEARNFNTGVMLLGLHSLAGLGRQEVINVWLRPQLEPLPMEERLNKGSLNLGILMALRLQKAWKGDLNLITVVATEADRAAAEDFLRELQDLARIPMGAKTLVLVGSFQGAIAQAPQGDMNFFGLQTIPDFQFVRQTIEFTGASCLFISDSGSESAIA